MEKQTQVGEEAIQWRSFDSRRYRGQRKYSAQPMITAVLGVAKLHRDEKEKQRKTLGKECQGLPEVLSERMIPDIQRLMHPPPPMHCQHDVTRIRTLRIHRSFHSLAHDNSCLSVAALTRPKHDWKPRRHSRPSLTRNSRSGRS